GRHEEVLLGDGAEVHVAGFTVLVPGGVDGSDVATGKRLRATRALGEAQAHPHDRGHRGDHRQPEFAALDAAWALEVIERDAHRALAAGFSRSCHALPGVTCT